MARGENSWRGVIGSDECTARYISEKQSVLIPVVSSALKGIEGAPKPVRQHCSTKIFKTADIDAWLDTFKKPYGFELAAHKAHSKLALERYYKRKAAVAAGEMK